MNNVDFFLFRTSELISKIKIQLRLETQPKLMSFNFRSVVIKFAINFFGTYFIL